MCGYVDTPNSSVARGWIVRMDKNSNVIWSREVTRDSTRDMDEYLYNVVSLKDGSFVAAGASQGQDTLGRWTQDGWLIRFDRNGCVEPGCSLGIAKEPNLVNNQFRVYPNPSQGIIHLSAKQGFPKVMAITLLDNSGRRIKQLSAPAGKTIVSYNLNGLASGVYYLEIKAQGLSQRQKLVIVR